MARTVLVTGVSRSLGDRMVRELIEDPGVDHVVAVDVIPPRGDIGGAQFVRADIRNPSISKVLEASGADTVLHMGVIATPLQAGGRASMKEINVIGTMQLLAACQRSATVQRLVVRSTSMVYGAGSKDPAAFTEDTEPKSPPTGGWGKDSVEVEGYVRGFARRRPDVSVTMLRFANVLGPTVSTATTAYFSLPVVPTVLGHDARMHFIHEDDLIESLRQAAVGDQSGTFNVAGAGVIMLSQAVRLAGRQSLPLPGRLVGLVGGRLTRGSLPDFSPGQVQFLTYGRGLDLTRLATGFGFFPAFTTRETFESFVAGGDQDRSGGRSSRERFQAIEQGIAHALGVRTVTESATAARLSDADLLEVPDA
jgi:UDP-glucose 4-epimerase